MFNIHVIIGVIGSEDALECREFGSWEDCNAWMQSNRKEGFWYKIFA